MLEFLEGEGANHDVVMFVNSACEAERLEQLIESQSIAVIRATEFMSPPELKDIQASWNSSINSGQCILGVLVSLYAIPFLKDGGFAFSNFRNSLNFLFETSSMF